MQTRRARKRTNLSELVDLSGDESLSEQTSISFDDYECSSENRRTNSEDLCGNEGEKRTGRTSANGAVELVSSTSLLTLGLNRTRGGVLARIELPNKMHMNSQEREKRAFHSEQHGHCRLSWPGGETRRSRSASPHREQGRWSEALTSNPAAPEGKEGWKNVQPGCSLGPSTRERWKLKLTSDQLVRPRALVLVVGGSVVDWRRFERGQRPGEDGMP